MFRPNKSQMAHLMRASVTGIVLLAFVGGVFFLFTTQIFAVALWSGIWYFALVLLLTFVFFFVMAFINGFHVHNRVERLLFMLTGLGLIAASIALGIKFKPFDPANIHFGALLDDDLQSTIMDNLPEAQSSVSYKLPLAKNQGSCGGCWAFASALVISVRANQAIPVASKNVCLKQLSGDYLVSPQALIDADTMDPTDNTGKCNGQYVSTGFELGGADGLGGMVDEARSPIYVQLEPNCSSCSQAAATTYKNTDGKTIQGCFEKDGYRPTSAVPKVVVTSKPYRIFGENAIMKEISARGPVVATINFYRKKNGNYPAWSLASVMSGSLIISSNYVTRPGDDGTEYTKNFVLGAHALVIYGYGQRTDGLKYWEVRNSWGTSWGVEGSSKIERGVDAWNIESYCVAALVKSLV